MAPQSSLRRRAIRPAPPPSGRAGFTLAELAGALALLAVLLGWGLPRLRAGLDRWAVLGAREALISALSSARATALDRGGSWLVADVERARVTWGAGPDSLGWRGLSEGRGVRLLDGPGVEAVVRFDDLGRGQVASRTFTLVKGSARGGVSLSSYGRVRRW
jgi:type II secretory pathway pseudopilin PulG